MNIVGKLVDALEETGSIDPKIPPLRLSKDPDGSFKIIPPTSAPTRQGGLLAMPQPPVVGAPKDTQHQVSVVVDLNGAASDLTHAGNPVCADGHVLRPHQPRDDGAPQSVTDHPAHTSARPPPSTPTVSCGSCCCLSHCKLSLHSSCTPSIYTTLNSVAATSFPFLALPANSAELEPSITSISSEADMSLSTLLLATNLDFDL